MAEERELILLFWFTNLIISHLLWLYILFTLFFCLKLTRFSCCDFSSVKKNKILCKPIIMLIISLLCTNYPGPRLMKKATHVVVFILLKKRLQWKCELRPLRGKKKKSSHLSPQNPSRPNRSEGEEPLWPPVFLSGFAFALLPPPNFFLIFLVGFVGGCNESLGVGRISSPSAAVWYLFLSI